MRTARRRREEEPRPHGRDVPTEPTSARSPTARPGGPRSRRSRARSATHRRRSSSATTGGSPRRWRAKLSEAKRTERPDAPRLRLASGAREDRERPEVGCAAASSSRPARSSSGSTSAHVDSVVLLESPKGIARGLQRVGRSGHLVGETARGLLVPLFLDDLFEMRRDRGGDARGGGRGDAPARLPARRPRAAARRRGRRPRGRRPTRHAADLFALVRSACPYRALPRSLFLETLAMLSGKYPKERFAALAPKLVWDRATDRVTPLPGARLAALLDGGTIGDRGTFRAVLQDRQDRRRRAGRGVRPRDEGGRRLPPRFARVAGRRDRARPRRRRGRGRAARAADALLAGRGPRPHGEARRRGSAGSSGSSPNVSTTPRCPTSSPHVTERLRTRRPRSSAAVRREASESRGVASDLARRLRDVPERPR